MPKKEKKQNTLKVLSLPTDDGGCGWYRIRQPFEFLQSTTEHECHVIDDRKDDMVQVFEAMKVADIAVMRQGAEVGLEALNKYPEINPKWVLDIDDNIEVISPYSEHYKDYGTQEFYDNNSKVWIWKNGKSDFDAVSNKVRVLGFIERGLKNADLVTVTTNKLADYAKKYNKNVIVLPNCINFDRWWRLSLSPNKQLRVGWSGGVSHYEDWYAIKEPLNELMREYDFKLVMVGSYYKGVIDEDNRKNTEVHDWLPFKGHSYRMMCLGLDIALIPLADLPFNHYKSSIKWYEMSAIGIPSVVSNILPYSEDIKEGETALGYSTPKQFYTALKTLLDNPQMRKKIGYGARKWVKDNRDAKDCAKLWEKAYTELHGH